MMDILVGLIPAILWGVMPISINKLGGKPINQLVGTVYGAVILGLIIVLIDKPAITGKIFFWNFVAGACWGFGQITQYSAYTEIGVSRVMPLTTGMQLALVSLIGVLFFGSWQTALAKILGFMAIILDIIGAVMTASREKSASGNIKRFRHGVLITLVGTLGFVAYNSLPKIPNASGWRMFFPQTLGMLTFSVIISLFFSRYRKDKPLINKNTFKNILTGLMFGGACCGFLFSIRLNGLSTGFTLSQFAMVIATVSGITVLHEHKTHKELIYTLIGVALVLAGSIIVGTIQ